MTIIGVVSSVLIERMYIALSLQDAMSFALYGS